MPQTIYFENKDKEKEMAEIFSNHKNLTICTREKYSYNLAKKIFDKNNIILCPDMAFLLFYKKNLQKIKVNKDQCLMIFRNDKEKFINNEIKQKVIERVKQNNQSIKFVDTVINKKIFKFNRNIHLNKLLFNIRKSNIIITDRLHGMILSTICGRKCIAFSNNNYKVKGIYKWIENIDTVKFVNNIEEFNIAYNELVLKDNKNFDVDNFSKYYKELIEHLNSN